MANVSLGDHFSSYVRRRVEAGHFSNVSEVIRDALRLHEHHAQIQEAKLEALRRDVDEAGASLDRGEGRHLNVDDIFEDVAEQKRKA